ncbi:MAG: LytTR family transcriptional regulator [Bacteroidaceae bacterium]|nr:LytTR family transcriptional regulator [Bacteroidaceae bacterium]
MRRLWMTIGYWTLSVLLIAIVVHSLGYSYGASLLIGTMFLPGALAAKFLLPKVKAADRKRYLLSLTCVVGAILALEFLAIVLSHILIENIHDEFAYDLALPVVLVNPIFVAAVITLLIVGDMYVTKYLSRRFPTEMQSVSFVSDRKKVTLLSRDISYVESRDTEVWIHTTAGDTYRNKTGISQWEAMLGDEFIRVHRSFLVNKSSITSCGADTLFVGSEEIPVSRKYRQAVHDLFPLTETDEK